MEQTYGISGFSGRYHQSSCARFFITSCRRSSSERWALYSDRFVGLGSPHYDSLCKVCNELAHGLRILSGATGLCPLDIVLQ